MEVILALIVNIILWIPIYLVLNHPKTAEIEIKINKKLVSISFIILFLISASQIQTLIETYIQ